MFEAYKCDLCGYNTYLEQDDNLVIQKRLTEKSPKRVSMAKPLTRLTDRLYRNLKKKRNIF